MKNHNLVTKISILALGANMESSVGRPERTIAHALKCLAGIGQGVRGVSRFYSTPCFPAGVGPDYVNAAAVLAWDGSPQKLMTQLHEIETKFERTRETRWGQRTLDLDLIAFDTAILPDTQTFRHWLDLPLELQRREAPDRLVLPHPRVHERAFVLVPVCDVAPNWRHPVLGQTASELCAALPRAERDAVQPL